MDEQLTELEKLQRAAQLIEEMSQGRLLVCRSAVGQVYIQARDDSSLGMDMRIDSIPGQRLSAMNLPPSRCMQLVPH
mgnify:CR=1 FL=1